MRKLETIMSSLCPIRSWHTQLIPVANAFSSRALSTCDNMTSKYNSIIIIGGGIAGLSTARYILQHEKNIEVTIVDKNNLSGKQLDPYLTYDKQQVDLLHYNIPSRRNGNVLCPSLTIPWTTRSLWSEAFLPLLKSYFGKKGKGSMPTTISFDVPSLLTNTNMWSFAYHFFTQKYLYSNTKHQSNKSILDYNMKCLDDPSDALIQRIDYGRCAKGTQLLDGTVVSSDSSGDIGLFSQGLLDQLQCEYADRLNLVYGEEATKINRDGGAPSGITSMNQNGNEETIEADAIVVACGVASTSLCNSISIPCPVFPAKGHLATVSSKIQCEYNITLPGGLGYAAPMTIRNLEGRYLYRLSGFVDFTLSQETDFSKIEALVEAAKLYLPDLELVDASACHRPVSADDRPIVGSSKKYSNVYLCTGLGSRGWSVGLGCGKLLSSIILGLPCEIDPTPFAPNRFRS